MPSRTAALLASLLLAGCGGGSSTADPEPSDPAAQSSQAPSETPSATRSRDEDAQDKPVPETLAFQSTTVDGDAFEGASLAGKPALLWFWAPWCPTCRSQVPQVETLAEEYEGEVAVIGVGSLDSAEAIAAFAADVEGVTHLEDVDGALYRQFGIAEQSSFVLLDADGEVAFETGYGGSDDLADEVADVAASAG
jgi:thiol-disulfide isomerase/thioredoxin